MCKGKFGLLQTIWPKCQGTVPSSLDLLAQMLWLPLRNCSLCLQHMFCFHWSFLVCYQIVFMVGKKATFDRLLPEKTPKPNPNPNPTKTKPTKQKTPKTNNHKKCRYIIFLKSLVSPGEVFYLVQVIEDSWVCFGFPPPLFLLLPWLKICFCSHRLFMKENGETGRDISHARIAKARGAIGAWTSVPEVSIHSNVL